MNLTSPRAVKQILDEHGIKPSRGLGQNFLIDYNVVKRLIAAAHIEPTDTVLEVGPGIGTLTQELAREAKKVVAAEKDKNLVRVLEGLTVGMENIKILHADILKLNPSDIPTLKHSYKVVSNLPYYITAPVIRKFLEAENPPESLTLMAQKEVAQRICSKPPNMSILAVSVQIYAVPKIISYAKKGSFWPQPKVDAAILQITPLAQPYPVDSPKFFTTVKAGFKQPRKQLVNNLSAGLGVSREKTERWLLQNSINPARRAETLSIQDWINLANTL